MSLTHDEYLKLVNKLVQLNEEYYKNNESSVSDYQYDEWYKQLKTYEINNPLLVDQKTHQPNMLVQIQVRSLQNITTKNSYYHYQMHLMNLI